MMVLEEIEEAIQSAVGRTGPAVIGLGQGWGRGSGFVVDAGRILTNAHNLRGDEVSVTFHDGRRETGRVLASDQDLDLAVIEADTAGIEPIQWSESEVDSLPIGRSVLALANPGGRGLRVTPGFVSSTARSFRGPRGRRVGGAIEHTAPLPRGSSGGPLIDGAGWLLGVNAVRADGGLILAVPADRATRERVEKLSLGEAPRRARLGVAVAPPRVARRMRRAVGLPERDGILIRAVERGSAADRAGLERGDLIVAAGGHDLERIETLYEVLDRASADGELELRIIRGAEERTVSVSL
ncbi:MAG: serine protease [Solirubrobacterales bacterium]|nr:serine protease [Solirubrobacterales bacterium]MBV9945061.1 serine protease [Solirubrobacterales bacterium]